jgi:hypothetical protein
VRESESTADERTFLEACLADLAKPEDIEAWIERWDHGPRDQDLTAFLGLSISVYREWVNDPPSLARNIESLRELYRKHGGTEASGCDLCADFPASLHAHCHPSAPLRAVMEAEGVLVLRCYVPTCNREVARLHVTGAPGQEGSALPWVPR